MAVLEIYNEDGSSDGEIIREFEAVREQLAQHNVELEAWDCNAELAADAGQEEVLAAYQSQIDALNKRYGFESVDVVALRPDNPDKATFREKFLSEHTHADFEVRYFVDGSGLFYLHLGDKVFHVFCEKGDLISVPASTTHWFDMGANPDFKCIRLFTTADGWVGEFTGSDIASRFPDFDQFKSRIA